MHVVSSIAGTMTMAGRELKATIVRDTISFSIELGRLLRERRSTAPRLHDPLQELFAQSLYGDLFHLYTGRVVDYSSSIVGGYDVGRAPQISVGSTLAPVTRL